MKSKNIVGGLSKILCTLFLIALTNPISAQEKPAVGVSKKTTSKSASKKASDTKAVSSKTPTTKAISKKEVAPKATSSKKASKEELKKIKDAENKAKGLEKQKAMATKTKEEKAAIKKEDKAARIKGITKKRIDLGKATEAITIKLKMVGKFGTAETSKNDATTIEEVLPTAVAGSGMDKLNLYNATLRWGKKIGKKPLVEAKQFERALEVMDKVLAHKEVFTPKQASQLSLLKSLIAKRQAKALGIKIKDPLKKPKLLKDKTSKATTAKTKKTKKAKKPKVKKTPEEIAAAKATPAKAKKAKKPAETKKADKKTEPKAESKKSATTAKKAESSKPKTAAQASTSKTTTVTKKADKKVKPAAKPKTAKPKAAPAGAPETPAGAEPVAGEVD